MCTCYIKRYSSLMLMCVCPSCSPIMVCILPLLPFHSVCMLLFNGVKVLQNPFPKLADFQAWFYWDTHLRKRTYADTHTDTPRRTPASIDIHRHTRTRTHTHTCTHTHARMHARTHTHTHTHTHGTHTHTHTHDTHRCQIIMCS